MPNDMDRYHLVTDVIVRQRMVDQRLALRAYTREVGDDAPAVRDWVWPFDAQAGSAA